MRFDVVVIGAGVAGLSSARIHTIHVPGLALPIELGAELGHGEARATFSIVEAAAFVVRQLLDDHGSLGRQFIG